jgi:hypothetical protein
MNSDTLVPYSRAYMEDFEQMIERLLLDYYINELPFEVRNIVMEFNFGEKCNQEPPPPNEVFMWFPRCDPGGNIVGWQQECDFNLPFQVRDRSWKMCSWCNRAWWWKVGTDVWFYACTGDQDVWIHPAFYPHWKKVRHLDKKVRHFAEFTAHTSKIRRSDTRNKGATSRRATRKCGPRRASRAAAHLLCEHIWMSDLFCVCRTFAFCLCALCVLHNVGPFCSNV